jgi:hypothetical protein
VKKTLRGLELWHLSVQDVADGVTGSVLGNYCLYWQVLVLTTRREWCDMHMTAISTPSRPAIVSKCTV